MKNTIGIDKLNVDCICTAQSFIDKRDFRFKYRESKRRYLFWIKKEGFYYTEIFGREVFKTKEQIEKNTLLICKEKEVYMRPHLDLYLSNRTTITIPFETEKELFDFMETEPIKSINWINFKG